MSEEEYEEITIRKEIEALVASDPFRAFVIIMVSGDRYAIDNGQVVVFSRDAITVTPLRAGGINVLRFSQVSSIEIPEPK